MVVYDLNDLAKELKNKKGVVGHHGLHTFIHNGHRHLIKKCKEKCDITIGIYYTNFAKMVEYICKEESVSYDVGVIDESLKELENEHDIVMVFKDDYMPFWKGLRRQCIEEYPNINLDKRNYQSLRTSQALVHVLNKHFYYDYNFMAKKEGWREDYKKWYDKIYPNKVVIVSTLRDEKGKPYGNNIYRTRLY